MTAKQGSKSNRSRQDLSATIQWVAIAGVFVLIVLAVFVFGIGGSGGTGGGHTN